MAFDPDLAQQVREALAGKRGVVERKMFGGLAFMMRGNMCCGVSGNDLMVRVGLERYEDALARPHARPMDFTGKPLRGFVYVGPDGHDDLKAWVARGLAFVRTLPPK
jgi:TfoX/Sxy family transcriptional regulator of competence genes